MSIAPGANVGPYQIMEQIGRGGMATVYKAYQPSLARFVAVKVLPSFYIEEPGFLERFHQEALAAARLRHPNIVAVYDYGHVDNAPYLVSEFIDGGSLNDQVGVALPVDYVVRMLAPIADALDYAHAQGIVHRDIKPANILLARDGRSVLADFGIAKLADETRHLTRTGAVVGTPEYMAPEQALGENAGPASDQYALAIMVYQMLTGRVPFNAQTPLSVLVAHIQQPLPPPRLINANLRESVEAVLIKGLAKRPEERYATVSEFVTALGTANKAPRTAPTALASPAEAPSATAPDGSEATDFAPARPAVHLPLRNELPAQPSTGFGWQGITRFFGSLLHRR